MTAAKAIVQDDVREQQLITLFGMEKRDDSRQGVDAILDIDGHELPFEIKSTSRGSVTTVRDFGLDHVRKWTGKHWLIGVYDRRGQSLRYSLYGSPELMWPWIESKRQYIMPDLELAKLAPELIEMRHLSQVCGDKTHYSLEDAKSLHKRQLSIAEYRARMDQTDGFSRTRMLELLRDRAQYLLQRGSTLNNPHIPASYFNGWEQITDQHACRLVELVRAAGYPRT